jgi:hypothetical protein
MVYLAAAALMAVSLVSPGLGIILQGAWLLWAYLDPSRRRMLVRLALPVFLALHLVLQLFPAGPQDAYVLLDIPYSLGAIAVAVRARREIPWWVTLLCTAPLVGLALAALVVYLVPALQRQPH